MGVAKTIEESSSEPPQKVAFMVATRAAMLALGQQLAQILRPGDLVILTGGLGAGKTTMTQGLGAGLGVRGPITSPTFVIARVHPSLAAGPQLVHVDAYRLANLGELDDLDLDTSLADSVTVVEWGAGLAEELAADRLEIEISRSMGRPTGPDGDRRGRPASASTDAESTAATGQAAPDDTDDIDEDRLVTIVGCGPRWAGGELHAMAAQEDD